MSDNKLDRYIRETLAEPVPDEVRGRLHNRTTSFLADGMRSPRDSKLWAKRLTLVAALLMVVGAVIWHVILINGTVDAYAQVAEQLRKIRTLSMTINIVLSENPEMNMKVKYMHKAPSHVRLIWESGLYDVFETNSKRSLTVEPNLERYQYETIQDYDDNQMLFVLDLLKNLPVSEKINATSQILNGMEYNTYSFPFEDTSYTLWINKNSGILYRITLSSERSIEEGLKYYQIFSDIVINPDLPDSLFDMTPPPGYRLRVLETE